MSPSHSFKASRLDSMTLAIKRCVALTVNNYITPIISVHVYWKLSEGHAGQRGMRNTSVLYDISAWLRRTIVLYLPLFPIAK